MAIRQRVSVETANLSSYHVSLSEAKELVAKNEMVWIEPYKRAARVPPELKIRGLSCRIGEFLAITISHPLTQVMLKDIRRQAA